MLAAVLRQLGDERLELMDVELAELGPGMIQVAMRATGVCHSDTTAMSGTYPIETPCVLGHEGAGQIIAIGSGVTELEVGDHVIATGVTQCGSCPFCRSGQGHLCIKTTMVKPHFRIDGEPVFALAGIGSFSEQAVFTQDTAVKIPRDVPWEVAAPIGCGITTGVGAVLNAAKVTPGSSVVVFGCGGVGAAVIQSARLVGAAQIVAVDPAADKREAAKGFGATHAVAPEELERVKAEITADNDGFDYGFEAIGLPVTIRATYDAVRRGGTAVIVGVGRSDEPVGFNAYELAYDDKTLRGTWFGSGDPRQDFLRLLGLWRSGRLDIEGMVSHRGRLSDINEALDNVRAGRAIRTVLTP
jgi:S-(hydroxymethyl)glutathione dehydrogenase / alcohol dehydrogenase